MGGWIKLGMGHYGARGETHCDEIAAAIRIFLKW